MKKISISASILGADTTRIAEEIEMVEKYVDMIHVDVMDGHFVPNISFGTKTVRDIRGITALPVEVHLMISNPDQFIDKFITAGASIIIYHTEVVLPDMAKLMNEKITDAGVKAGISINPDTLPQVVMNYTDNLYEILVMSVNPGFGSQSFIPNSLEKLRWLKANLPPEMVMFNIDGGVNISNVNKCIEAGADILSIGSGIFLKGNATENVSNIKKEIEQIVTV
ncbi:MAG: ribulose-phosphate 3-epimerase [Candidatus Thermoplasmatota archaeon]|nr:ribulose-phosphate 3-epimerase [Candidatus Thermoplasmatota archaeon]MCL5963488.1 ribulose-phosphate 3-epimerase [Candidatus Thermoplasmatota archaeon]